jgi:CubicO group peptidase (beta-lactamase class C family)
MEREVFAPLGMTRTVVGSPQRLGADVAANYAFSTARVPQETKPERGAAGMYSTVEDLLRFASLHLSHGKSLLTAESLATMHRPALAQTPGFGLGFEIEELWGTPTWGHSGGAAGVATWLLLVPAHDIAIVVLTNADSIAGREIQKSILSTLVPAIAAKAHDWTPAPDLIGRWLGAVDAGGEAVAVVLEIAAQGAVTIRIGEARSQPVTAVEELDGLLSLYEIDGTLPVPGVPTYPHRIDIRLRREGERLSGSATADARALRDRGGHAVSWWIDLRRAP